MEITNEKNKNMEKYSNLKRLSGIINFIAWLNLIAGIIIAFYLNSKNLGTIISVSSVVSGFIGFILLLSFGKLMELVLDIRENQIGSKEVTLTKEFESKNQEKNQEIEFSEKVLLDLRKYILNQKKSLIGKNKNEILEFLSRLITTKQTALDLIIGYEKYFGVDIIDELKSLSSNYGTIREYLEKFIEFEIVEKEHPHKMI